MSNELKEAVQNPFDSREDKLGLALSGGGFRASLFHIGVLARMAELEILGKVDVISAVSGGSVVAGMYYLMLKRLMEQPTPPTAADYVELVRRLERLFLAGVQTNPRTRLVTDPLQNVRMLLSDYSRTERMAKLLYRQFYQQVWQEAMGGCPDHVPLREIKINPPGYASRDDYNAAHDYKIPILVINATTLNTGKNFRFTASEVGDPDLGYIRFDTVGELMALRRWLMAPSRSAPPAGFTPELQQLATAIYSGAPAPGGRLVAFFSAAAVEQFRRVPLGALYKMRDLAWEATHGEGAGAEAAFGMLRGHLNRLGITTESLLQTLAEPEINFYDLLDRIYLARLVRQVADTCAEDMSRLTLERAVAASAAVPGIFEPIVFRDVYDDAVVETVRLADGGVYDNQGLTALFEEECTHVICSDASGQLVFERDATGKIFGVLPRTNDVLMEKVRADELDYLRITHDTTHALLTLGDDGHVACPSGRADCEQAAAQLRELHRVKQTAFFHLRSVFPPAGLPAPTWELQDAISKIRTDLDSFTDNEADTLMYDGYYLASHTLVPQWFSDFVPPTAAPQTPPPNRWAFYPLTPDSRRLLGQMKVASERLFKVFRIGTRWGVLAWLVALGIFVLAWAVLPPVSLNSLLVWPLRIFGIQESLTVGSFVPFSDAVVERAPALKDLVDFSVLPVGDLFSLRIHVPLTLLVCAILYVLSRLWGPIKAFLLSGETRRIWPWVRFALQWKKSPLFPIAVVWALVAAGLAWVHLWVFDSFFLNAGARR